MAGRERRPLRGDEAELFREFNEELMRRVRRAIVGPDAIVEDACAFAWAKFLENQPDRERNWRGWLVEVAKHEAYALTRIIQPTIELKPELADAARSTAPGPTEPHDKAAIREGVDEVITALRPLPDRMRRAAFLRALGLPWKEIMEVTGDSHTVVNRLLSAASARVQAERADRIAASGTLPPRAQRLADLERDPPPWLKAWIGAPPNTLDHRVGGAAGLLAWRRAALAIDDYRRRHVQDLPASPDGHRPPGREAARAWELVEVAIERARSHRRSHGREL